MIEFLFVVGFIIIYGCYKIGKGIGNSMFPKEKDFTSTYIDKSVHHYYYDNRSVNVDGEKFKNLK